MYAATTTVAQLKKMLGELPNRLEDVPVFVHVAAEDGWAMAALKPQVGRTSSDSFVLLAVDLPDELEEYASDEEELPPLRVIK